MLVTLNKGTQDGHHPGLCDGVTQNLRVLEESHTAVHQWSQLHSIEGGSVKVCMRLCIGMCVHVCAHTICNDVAERQEEIVQCGSHERS